MAEERDGCYDSFEALGLKKEVVEGIKEYGGYKKPTKVQQIGIPLLLQGSDVIFQAKNQPSKRATYCSWILQRLDLSVHKCQAIIVVSSDAASKKITVEMEGFGCNLGVKVYALRGLSSRCDPITDVHVVVGTCCGVLKMLQDERLCSVKMLVLDDVRRTHQWVYEAEQAVEEIFRHLHDEAGEDNIQVGVFHEEEIPGETVEMLESKMKAPLTVEVDEMLNLDGIKKHQFLSVANKGLRPKAICRLFSRKAALGVEKPAIVIAKFQDMRDLIYKEMVSHNEHKVYVTSRDMKQNDRGDIARKLLDDSSGGGVLITTFADVRGIEVGEKVKTIVTSELWFDSEYLVVFGRFKADAAISLPCSVDWDSLFDIEEMYDVAFEKLDPPIFPKHIHGRHIKHVSALTGNDTSKNFALTYYVESIKRAGKCVIFVPSSDKECQLKDFLVSCPTYRVAATKQDLAAVEDGHPMLLITSPADMMLDVQVQVPLVICYDMCATPQEYDYCLSWCVNHGVVIHLAGDEDWPTLFDIRHAYGVKLLRSLSPDDLPHPTSTTTSNSKDAHS